MADQIAQQIQQFAAQMQHQQEQIRILGEANAQLREQIARRQPADVVQPRISFTVPDAFDGQSSADQWLFLMDAYFAATNTPGEVRVPFATLRLKDAALSWWRAKPEGQRRVMGWAEFSETIQRQFARKEDGQTARKKLDGLTQGRDLLEYVRQFRSLILQVADMAEADRVHRFTSGLKPSTRRWVQISKPATLDDAITVACQVEDLEEGTGKKLKAGDAGEDSWNQGSLRFSIDDELLWVTEAGNRRLCVPNGKGLRLDLIHDHHDAKIAGHFGRDKTYDSIKRFFYWPKMIEMISEYVSTCDICQRIKSDQQKPAGLLQPLPILERNWQQISMDFIVQLPKTKTGFDAIVVFVDRLSKMARFAPTRTDATAPDTARIFFDHVFRNHGLPEVIVSDRDAKFTSLFWRSLFKMMGVKLAMSTAFHPQTDGQTERMNRTLEQYLKGYVDHNQSDWDQLLITAEFAYNSAQQSSTKRSPFVLNYGQEPRVPTTLMHFKGGEEEKGVKVHQAEEFKRRLDDLLQSAKTNLEKAQADQTKYANQKRREVEFKVGDKVLVSTEHLVTDLGKNQPSKKLRHKYTGPFEIVKEVGPNAFRLDLKEQLKVHPVFNASKLKPYLEDAFEKITATPPILTKQGHEEWEVEEILEERTVKRGRGTQKQFLVKWKGYPLHDATWEPEANLQNAPKALSDFHRRGSKLKEGRM